MAKTYRQGATGALLDEYERAIMDLQSVIDDITGKELTTIVDSRTADPNCISVGSILSHVVRAGYNYAIYINQWVSGKNEFRDYVFHSSVQDYQRDLNDVFIFTTEIFKDIADSQLERSNDSEKIITSWGQLYDIEQITEHAIVHILRHRRQIEKFKLLLRG